MPGVIDFLNSDDESGRPGPMPDISDALLGSSNRRLTTTMSSSAKKAGKQRASGANAVDVIDNDDDEAEADFIKAAISKQNMRSGTDVLKKTVGKGAKGKNKASSGQLSGGGSFQSMGLHPSLLRSLVLRGFTTPTPIQRQTIPAILEQPPRDVVGMARTGSGKTLAYIVPLIQRLNGRHSSTVGVKSIILCPSRELALQILKVGKEVARGWKADEGGEAIRWGLIVGGEGMDEQFALMATNPDVIIATPGRLLHLTVEMGLDLKGVTYVVFDEADRLFEMGFATQLEEILERLPTTSRQTLLFSATLPKSLVDFARAGLQANPKLVRLDADSKISEDLRMAFFSVKPTEKEAALLLLLRDVIGVPLAEEQQISRRAEGGAVADARKRKRGAMYGGRNAALTGADELLPYQTIIFVATKHHVEYLLMLLTTAGYTCSHIYSSLDQAARGLEMKRFREGESSLLIVTDVAARGIDLPVLEHVVNYDFPSSPRVFVHRVGRTARAGKRGFAWNLIHHSELPYLCDLQLFLARPLVAANNVRIAAGGDGGEAAADGTEPIDMHNQLIVGTLPRDALDNEVEFVNEGLANSNSRAAVALPALKQVVARAHKMYVRSQTKASQESYRRAKEMTREGGGDEGKAWALAGSVAEESSVHDVVRRPHAYGLGRKAYGGTTSADKGQDAPPSAADVNEERAVVAQRAALLAKVNGFRPSETVFEVGARGATPNALLMKDRRRVMDGKRKRGAAIEAAKSQMVEGHDDEVAGDGLTAASTTQAEQADEHDILSTFDVGAPSQATKRQKTSYRDESVYMDYEQRDAHTERGYSMRDRGAGGGGDSFTEQANRVTFGLTGDEGARLGTQSQAPNTARWDVKKKKFIRGDGVGADNKKMITTESGKKLPASFRSGRFDEWAKSQRLDVQRVGEKEDERTVRTARGLVARSRGQSASRNGHGGSSSHDDEASHPRGPSSSSSSLGRRFAHSQTKSMRRPDKFQDDYKKKMVRYKAQNEGESSARASDSRGRAEGGGGSKSGGGKAGVKGGRRTGGKARSELKSATQVYKDRQVATKRKEKNARPSRKKKGGRR